MTPPPLQSHSPFAVVEGGGRPTLLFYLDGRKETGRSGVRNVDSQHQNQTAGNHFGICRNVVEKCLFLITQSKL